MKETVYKSQRYDVTSLVNIVEVEIDPECMASRIEDILFSYVDDRLTGGDGGSQVAGNVYALRLLLDAFRNVRPRQA